MGSIVSIDDIKASLPPALSSLLEANSVDLPTWEAVQFAWENKQWGTYVVLTTDEDNGQKQGKYLRVLGESLFKVDSFIRDEVLK